MLRRMVDVSRLPAPLTVVVVCLLAAPAAMGEGHGQIRICYQARGYLTAHSMTCRKAHRIGHKFVSKTKAPHDPTRLKVEGFRCHIDRQRIICRRGVRYFTWDREP